MTTTLSAGEMERLRRLIDLARGHTDDVAANDYLSQSLKLLASAEGATTSALVQAGLAERDRRDAATVAVSGGRG